MLAKSIVGFIDEILSWILVWGGLWMGIALMCIGMWLSITGYDSEIGYDYPGS